MNNEEAFFKDIYDATGKEISKGDYGFILGINAPFPDYAEKGMMSTGKIHGYAIWKKTGEDIYEEMNIIPTSLEDSKRKIIGFLSNDGLAQSG